MNNNQRHNFKRIYYVNSDNDDTVLLALDITINEKEKEIKWFDTIKERIMHFETIEPGDDQISFVREESEGGGIYRFVTLTQDLYQEKVRDRTLFKKDFDNEEEMFKALEETQDNAW